MTQGMRKAIVGIANTFSDYNACHGIACPSWWMRSSVA